MQLQVAKYQAAKQAGELADGGVTNDRIYAKEVKIAAAAKLKQEMRGWYDCVV